MKIAIIGYPTLGTVVGTAHGKPHIMNCGVARLFGHGLSYFLACSYGAALSYFLFGLFSFSSLLALFLFDFN